MKKKASVSEDIVVNMHDFSTLVHETIVNSMWLKEYFRLNLIYYQLVSGKGLEFDRIREYYPGADPRRIDWKKNARTGVLYLRTFKEERHFDIVVAVDVSDTMLLGTTKSTKNEFAAMIAGVLMYAAIDAGDDVAICMHSERAQIVTDPSPEFYKQMSHLTDKKNYGGKKDWNKMTMDLLRNYDENSIIFIVSDFIDTDVESFLPELSSHFSKVYGIMLRDPLDISIPAHVGRMYLKGLENEELYLTDFERIREEYELLNKRQIQKIRESFRQYNQLFFMIKPGEDFGKEFIKALGSEEVIIS